MAITRKMLKAMGIEEEKSDQIIEAYREAIDPIIEARDNFKAQAEANADAAKKLTDLEKQVEDMQNKPDDEFKAKYEAEHKQFEDFKAQIEQEKKNAIKQDLYRGLLGEAGITDKVLVELVMKSADLSAVNVEEGAIVDADKLIESVKEQYPTLISTTYTKGSGVQTPPNGGANMTAEAFKAMPLSEQMQYANQHPEAVNWL